MDNETKIPVDSIIPFLLFFFNISIISYARDINRIIIYAFTSHSSVHLEYWVVTGEMFKGKQNRRNKTGGWVFPTKATKKWSFLFLFYTNYYPNEENKGFPLSL